MALTAGTRLGVYEIVSAIGAGGMGEVFLATDTRLDRRVALKVLPSAFALDDERRHRFMREARAASALSHPNVATIYDIGETSGVSYIAMEYIDGRTLADRIKGTTIALDDIAELGGQIADALYAAHECGVVHRDIKPGNVMITARGQAKVLDFGLAKINQPPVPRTADDVTREPATTPGIVMGTVAYMSPEQAIGAPLDQRTDLFSLGVVLYEMATRRLPFDGATDLHTIDLIRHTQPEAVTRYNVDVPSELERIIRKCLEKQPERRYQSAQELVIDLQALKRGTDAGRALPETPRHNLPSELTSFIGRRKELAELPRVLASSRLLSLTGAGGAGKTRLAVRLASDLVKEFADGVWLVDLAPLSAPDLVPQTIAAVLGIRQGPQRSVREALQENLRHRHLLLVLDNCEHLIDACAELAEALLRGAPALRILATSREALGVPGETVCRVPSLSLPEALPSLSAGTLRDSEAARLFMERATATEPRFTVTSENAATIADICRRLDGIPLAIELAAARVAVLSVEQINTRLQDRFRLLTGGTRTAVARQRTLEATVDWSYQLLSDGERQLLGRLSVFPAGWTLEAAEKICGGDGLQASDMLELLSKLVSKSLVSVDNDAGGERRYRFLETVRQYARERLMQTGGADRLRERHFEFFFNEFRGAMPILRGFGQLPCLRRLRIEQENVRATLEWGLTSSALAEEGVELAGALFWFWTKYGLFEEGKLWLERALAVAVHAPGRLRARALIGLAHMHYFQARYVETVALATEALSLGREENDAWVVSFALFMQGLAALERGDHEEAAARSLEAREAANASNDADLHGGPLLILANLAVSKGEHHRAQQLYDESIEVCRRTGETWGLGILLSAAAALRIIRGDVDQAWAQASEALSLCQEIEDARGIAWSLEVFAGLLAAGGHADGAARLWGASDGMLESVGGSLVVTHRWIRDRHIESVRTTLGEALFESARAEGRAMPHVQAVALARQQTLPVR